jgi:hypothetical protein
MVNKLIVRVPADENADNCLEAAAKEYIDSHQELGNGYDLQPRWDDEDDRETILLTVPEYAIEVGDAVVGDA